MTPLLRRRRVRRLPGLYPATVVDAADPEDAGRVLVSVPGVAGLAATWAPTVRGLGARPLVDDEVLVGFEAGRPSTPYVVGVLATAAPATVAVSDEHGNSIRLTPAGIALESAGAVLVTASTVTVATGSARIDTAVVEFSGVVRTPTLIADSVIAASYSPGVGNIS